MDSVRQMRSEHYKNYVVLCHINTKKDAGRLVCSFHISSQCYLHSSVKKFDPEQGTSVLINHSKLHLNDKKKTTVANVVAKVSKTQKSCIVNSAAFAASAEPLPLSFAYKNPGIVLFAKPLVDAGMSVTVSEKPDIEDMLPSDQVVKESIQRIGKVEHERYRVNKSKDVMGLGGGVTSDGLKNELNGTKYYDFTAHYFKLGAPHILIKTRSFELMTKNIFLIEQKEAKSASALSSAFYHALLTRIGCELDEFMKTLRSSPIVRLQCRALSVHRLLVNVFRLAKSAWVAFLIS
ncbi:hypothetical protein FGB62_71g00 [Gracilaria domingensis]|nr:hypothetical protein FGB62_71g00 [Gracilaria domingensis]